MIFSCARSPAAHPSVGSRPLAWGATFFSDWRDLVCSDEVDAVICAVPPVLNYQVAKKCSSFKKPLLVEKPLASSRRRAGGY